MQEVTMRDQEVPSELAQIQARQCCQVTHEVATKEYKVQIQQSCSDSADLIMGLDSYDRLELGALKGVTQQGVYGSQSRSFINVHSCFLCLSSTSCQMRDFSLPQEPEQNLTVNCIFSRSWLSLRIQCLLSPGGAEAVILAPVKIIIMHHKHTNKK